MAIPGIGQPKVMGAAKQLDGGRGQLGQAAGLNGAGLDQAGLGGLAGEVNQEIAQVIVQVIQELEQLLQQLGGEQGQGGEQGTGEPGGTGMEGRIPADQNSGNPYGTPLRSHTRHDGSTRVTYFNPSAPEGQRYTEATYSPGSSPGSSSPSKVHSHSPIILDLAGTGVPDVANGNYLPHAPNFDPSHAVMFDMEGTGKPQLTEWVGPNDGLLVQLNPKQIKPDGTADVNGNNLFGNTGGFQDGYKKLASLDKNGDGVLSGKELNGLYVWRDANSNGKVDPGEMTPVQNLGIKEIGAKPTGTETSWYKLNNGATQKTWDWWPSVVG